MTLISTFERSVPLADAVHGGGADPMRCCLWAVCACVLLLIVAVLGYGVARHTRTVSDERPTGQSLTVEMCYAVVPFVLAVLMILWAAR